MLLDTMTVEEVAAAKGVTEAAVRFAVNDRNNQSLLGVKHGVRLLILASSAETYTPRNYPRIEKLIEKAGVDRHQNRILNVLADLAAEIVADNPIAARILQSTFPASNIVVNGKAGYGLGIATPEDLRVIKDSPTIEVVFPEEGDKVVAQKARQWAIRLVSEGCVVPQ